MWEKVFLTIPTTLELLAFEKNGQGKMYMRHDSGREQFFSALHRSVVFWIQGVAVPDDEKV